MKKMVTLVLYFPNDELTAINGSKAIGFTPLSAGDYSLVSVEFCLSLIVPRL
ncbi:MAG: hypothetical protein JKY81_03965 [Colwellia sp.]|nr:hypothetical protein [Colwellia sp.]